MADLPKGELPSQGYQGAGVNLSAVVAPYNAAQQGAETVQRLGQFGMEVQKDVYEKIKQTEMLAAKAKSDMDSAKIAVEIQQTLDPLIQNGKFKEAADAFKPGGAAAQIVAKYAPDYDQFNVDAKKAALANLQDTANGMLPRVAMQAFDYHKKLAIEGEQTRDLIRKSEIATSTKSTLIPTLTKALEETTAGKTELANSGVYAQETADLQAKRSAISLSNDAVDAAIELSRQQYVYTGDPYAAYKEALHYYEAVPKHLDSGYVADGTKRLEDNVTRYFNLWQQQENKSWFAEAKRLADTGQEIPGWMKGKLLPGEMEEVKKTQESFKAKQVAAKTVTNGMAGLGPDGKTHVTFVPKNDLNDQLASKNLVEIIQNNTGFDRAAALATVTNNMKWAPSATATHIETLVNSNDPNDMLEAIAYKTLAPRFNKIDAATWNKILYVEKNAPLLSSVGEPRQLGVQRAIENYNGEQANIDKKDSEGEKKRAAAFNNPDNLRYFNDKFSQAMVDTFATMGIPESAIREAAKHTTLKEGAEHIFSTEQKDINTDRKSSVRNGIDANVNVYIDRMFDDYGFDQKYRLVKDTPFVFARSAQQRQAINADLGKKYAGKLPSGVTTNDIVFTRSGDKEWRGIYKSPATGRWIGLEQPYTLPEGF